MMNNGWTCPNCGKVVNRNEGYHQCQFTIPAGSKYIGQCPVCKQYVPADGTPHHCPVNGQTSYFYSANGSFPTMEQRIVDLERRIAALEKAQDGRFYLPRTTEGKP